MGQMMVDGVLPVIQKSGWLAPVLFILLHICRQLLFIPVVVICVVGGYLFGIFYGTIFSIIGLTAASMIFYYVVHAFPSWLLTLSKVKQKWLKDKAELTVMQIMILRVLPFIHFHLISLYLIEITDGFKEYSKFSLYASVPPALLYTGFGELLSEIPLYIGLFLISILLFMFYLVRKKPLHDKWDKRISPKPEA